MSEIDLRNLRVAIELSVKLRGLRREAIENKGKDESDLIVEGCDTIMSYIDERLINNERL